MHQPKTPCVLQAGTQSGAISPENHMNSIEHTKPPIAPSTTDGENTPPITATSKVMPNGQAGPPHSTVHQENEPSRAANAPAPTVTAIHQEQTTANALTYAEAAYKQNTGDPRTHSKKETTIQPAMRTTAWGFKVPAKNPEVKNDDAFAAKSGRITLEEFLAHLDPLPPKHLVDHVNELRISKCAVGRPESRQELDCPNTGGVEIPSNNQMALPKDEQGSNIGTPMQEIILAPQPFKDFTLVTSLKTNQVDKSYKSNANDPAALQNSHTNHSDDSKKPELPPKKQSAIYYMKQGGGYLWEQPSSQVVFANEATAKRALKQESTFDDLSKAQLEKKLYDIQTSQAIDYAGSLPGYRKGIHYENGLMLYCMQASELPVEIMTDAGAFGCGWPVIHELMRRLFITDGNEDQFWTVFAHLKVAQETLRGLLKLNTTGQKRNVQSGQAMALVGPKDGGKSLFLEKVIAPLIGGRMVDAFKAFTADSDGFNGELLNGEVWHIDDQEHSTDIRTRRRLAAHLKSKLFGAAVAFHPKHKTPITIKPFARLFICCNSTPENLTVLPPITDDISDKIHLILCNKAEIPMPLNSEEDRQLLLEELAKEIPYLAGELRRWVITEKFRSKRTGVLTYINPWIETQLRKQSPEAQLAELIIAAMNSGVIDKNVWEGSSRELKDVLTGESFIARRDAINLLGGWNAATGTYLSRLAANREEYVREFGLEVTEIGARGGIERYSVKNTIRGRHLDEMLQRIARQ
jgi:hypothetical protein